MSATRKILLVLSILVGCLGLFQAYDLTRDGPADLSARDVERHRSELRALEAGEAPPGDEKLGPAEKRERMENLRSWIESGEHMVAMDREGEHLRLRNTIIELVLAGGLAFAVVVMGRKDAPKALVRLGQARPGFVVSVLVGLLAGVLLVSFTRMLVAEQAEVTRAEQRLEEVKTKLENFKFDANGNVAEDQWTEFVLITSEAPYAPKAVDQAKANRAIAASVVLGSALALALSAYFGRRSWKRSFGPPAPAY